MVTTVQIILFVIIIVITLIKRSTKNGPRNWPIIGTLPFLLLNLRRLHDAMAEILQKSGGTFLFRYTWLANADYLVTTVPDDIRHIMVKKAKNYTRDAEWKKRFEIYGDGPFNTDSDDWSRHRGSLQHLFSHRRFHLSLREALRDAVESKLLPALSRHEEGRLLDMQVLLKNVLFHVSSRVVTGCDPPATARFPEAIEDAFEATFFRHLLPEWIWELQKRIGIGRERRFNLARETVDDLILQFISTKRKQVVSEHGGAGSGSGDHSSSQFDPLYLYLTGGESFDYINDDRVIRDNIFGILFASYDTTSTTLAWFFWLLSKSPKVEGEVVKEMRKYWPKTETKTSITLDDEKLNKMVYLHAALCETLRLYPPVPSEMRVATNTDILPSGGAVKPGTKVIIATYAMGRMRMVWGDDCEEFKPERWITKEGGIRYEPAHKFFAFNAGPRACLGKDIAFSMMKVIVINIFHHYRIRIDRDLKIMPKSSILLPMNNRLMVKIEDRCD